MAIVKTYNQQVDAYGGSDVVQTLTQASTGTTISRHGTTLITSAGSGSAANHGFILESPTKGVRKSIAVSVGSTRTVTVYTNSTTTTISGTSHNSILFSTGTTGAGVAPTAVQLVGVSTTAWAIVSKTTGVTTAASTVSA